MIKKVLFAILGLLLSNIVYSQSNISIKSLKQTYKNVQKIYKRTGGYEVLIDTDAFYVLSESGEKVSQLPVVEPDYYPCGNVYSEEYIIEESKEPHSKYKIKKSSDYSNGFMFPKVLYLKGIPENVDSISFLGGKKRYFWSENDDFFGRKKGYPHKILVYQNHKVGMYSYNPEKKYSIPRKKYVKKSDSIPLPPIFPFSEYIVNLTENIPIGNIQILYNRYENVIKVLSENKFTFLFDENPKTYDSAEKKTAVFYKVTKNGKTGFLDISENKEYGF